MNTEKQFIRLNQVINLTGLSRASIYNYIQENRFPKPAKFGKNSLWAYHEIQNWINDRLQERDENTEKLA